MLELIFNRDSKNKELNSYLFLILCLAVLKVIVAIFCFKHETGLVFRTSVLAFVINFIVLMLIQVPKDVDSKEFMDKIHIASFLILLFLYGFHMFGLSFIVISKFRISEVILYFLNFLSLCSWSAVNSIAAEKIGFPHL